MGTVAHLVVRVSANTSDFDKQLGSLERSWDKTGSKLQSIGARLTAGITIPLAGAALVATKFAADFEKSTTKLVTLSGVSTQEMQRMRQAVLALAPTVGIGPRALADALLVVTSTGFQGAQALQVLELAAKSSAVGMGDTKDVARALTAAVSAYGVENLSAAQAADVLHATVVAGGAEATELAGELGRVVGIASQLGVSFEEVGAFIATYTRLGLSAAEATTGLSGAFNTILNPSAEARKALAAVGLSADDLRKMVSEQGLGSALTALLGRLNGNADAIGTVFGNVRALAGVMGTAGVQAEQYAAVLDQIKGSTGGLNTAFEQTKKTFAFQWDQFKAQAERAAITLGTQLLPAMTRVLQAAKPLGEMAVALVNWFSQLPQPIQTGVIGFFALAAAIGPVSFAIGTLMRAGAGLAALFRTLKLGSAFSAMLTPIASAKAGVAGVYAAAASSAAAVAGVSALAIGWGYVAVKLAESIRLFGLWDTITSGVMTSLPHILPFGIGAGLSSGSQRSRMRSATPATPSLFQPTGAPSTFLDEFGNPLGAGLNTAGFDLPTLPGGGTTGGVTGATAPVRVNQFLGTEVFNAAKEAMADLKALGSVTKLTEEETRRLNTTLTTALDKYVALGKVAPQAMFDTWVATLDLKATTGLPGGLPGESVGLPSATGFYGNLLPTPGGVPAQLPGSFVSGGSNLLPQQPGFLAQAFGTSKQFGQKIGDAIISGISRGWAGVLGNIGGMVGGGVLGRLGDQLATKIGGMLGGVFSSVMGPLGSMLGGMFGGLVDKLFGPTEYELRTRDEEAKRQEIEKSLNMTDLQRQADMTGRGDLLAGVTSGLSTNNNPEYISGLLSQLNQQHEQLNAAMDRYGISWEQLGEKARQSQINQMAEQFVLDFQVLTQAGADVNFVIEKMGASVNEFINTALRTGTEVPMAMQPMLTKMSEMGLLVDDTGQQIELSSISWSMTMTQGFQQVADAVNHLAQALGFQLPAAAQVAAGGMKAAFAGLDIKVPVRFDVSGDVPEGVRVGNVEVTDINVEVPHAASGALVRARSGGTLVNVGEGGRDEAITPLPSSGMMGGGGVTVILQRSDGYEEARWLLPYLAEESYRIGLGPR